MTFGDNGAAAGMWAAIGQLEQNAVDEIIKTSVDAGINFIDTANVYSFGASETLTGKAIRNLGLKREDLVIATKVRGKMSDKPNDIGLSRKHIIQQCNESLQRLNMDYIDLYQIHGFDALTPFEEILAALDNLVQSGKVRYIGCSNLAAWQLMKALGIAAINHLSKFVSLQAYYTIAGRDLEREIIPLLLDQKIGLMVWSPLAGGFLSGKYGRNIKPEDSRRVNFDFPPINKEKAFDILDVMHEMAKEKNISVAQLALAWLLHKPAVTTVIIGAKKQEQLKDNLGATEIVLSKEEMEKLDHISKLTP
jgi:aryl-alcohol dehydrogenase-like predicted oxidoreductase